MAKPLYVSFLAEVGPTTAQALMGVISENLSNDYDELHLLLSTPGGTVREGIALYNLLGALPLKVITYNVGSVDSVGIVIFLAGKERYAARTSSFMFHGVGFDIPGETRFEEKSLVERLEGLKHDQELVADVIISRTKIGAKELKILFLEEGFLRAREAKSRGIIHDIREVRVPKGATFIQLVFQS